MFKIPEDELNLWKQTIENGDLKYVGSKKIVQQSLSTNQVSHIQKQNNDHKNNYLAKDDINVSDSRNSREIRKKIRQNSHLIDRTIDLHGFNKLEAYEYLKQVINLAYNNKLGLLLVITGKGKKENYQYQGILKQNLPLWLNEDFFKKRVKYFLSADQSDGGEGAFYVFIRK